MLSFTNVIARYRCTYQPIFVKKTVSHGRNGLLNFIRLQNRYASFQESSVSTDTVAHAVVCFTP